VTSIDAVAAFREALCVFQDEASRALLSIDEQARGALQWIENDAPVYWRQEIRNCFSRVSQARSALETARMRKVAGQRPSCIEELGALHAAQRRLREAEEKIEVVRRWAQRIRREIDDYRGRIMNLRRALDEDVPRTAGLLERTAQALETYVERPLDGEPPAPVSTESSPAITEQHHANR
jgi:acyl-CoA reductase-like NAD-dependent aldehyde dehydrogenase